MTPRDLKAHKETPKRLESKPVFKPQARKKLPKPLHRVGGPRIESTGLLNVSADHVMCAFWKDGQILTDRAFYAYLFCRLSDGALGPLFEFHWHPSHKGFHCKTPCNTTGDYTNRVLAGAPELALKTNHRLDPKNDDDRMKLVMIFCEWCGVSLPDNDANSHSLW
jgi:hypothetical protein